MSGLPSKGPPFETYMPTYSSIQRRPVRLSSSMARGARGLISTRPRALRLGHLRAEPREEVGGDLRAHRVAVDHGALPTAVHLIFYFGLHRAKIPIARLQELGRQAEVLWVYRRSTQISMPK